MDLLTQTVLGAAVGEVVLGKKAGNKAILWGAVGGLIPDLDVLITPFFSEVDGLFVHRGFSHSIVFAFLLSPLLAWLIHRIHREKMDISRLDWTKLMFWSIFTHPLIDYLTTYGTGAFLPFSGYRVEFGTVGIVDVFYTLSLLLVLLVIVFINRSSLVRRRLIVSVMVLTTLYLAGTVVNKLHVNAVFKDAFAKQGMPYERYKTAALPLSNFLWMGLAEVENGYNIALYSNFDSEKPSQFVFIPRNNELLEGLLHHKSLKKLIRFTKGYYHVNEDENGLYLADLRFGKAGIHAGADYVFKFYLRVNAGELVIERSAGSMSLEPGAFAAFLERIKGI